MLCKSIDLFLSDRCLRNKFYQWNVNTSPFLWHALWRPTCSLLIPQLSPLSKPDQLIKHLFTRSSCEQISLKIYQHNSSILAYQNNSETSIQNSLYSLLTTRNEVTTSLTWISNGKESYGVWHFRFTAISLNQLLSLTGYTLKDILCWGYKFWLY